MVWKRVVLVCLVPSNVVAALLLWLDVVVVFGVLLGVWPRGLLILWDGSLSGGEWKLFVDDLRECPLSSGE